ncbi:MAG TPA: DEAD/DEAH box helicase [Syntrophomonas sp.]|nr:DEAD/DEAH box helicase [Syntrophomonas sp.]
MSSFSELNISSPILRALQEMGFESPTAVQCEAIPHILNQEDLIVISKTGSGKTAVFGVSMLQLINPQEAGPQGLILTPTRELAVQVDSDLKHIGKHLPHKTTAVYGQHNINTEIDSLKKGVAIVAGTPGRVYDHIQHGTLKTNHIRFLVLDEADRMLDMGFIDQVRRIIRTLPRNRTTLLFSATIPPEVQKLCRENMKNPALIEIESDTMTVDTTEQFYYRVNDNEKRTQLNRLLQHERPDSCIIFCNMRSTVDRVQSFLTQKGIASRGLHGDIPQIKRLKTLQQFKEGVFHILVATDVAARGIHIDELALVINYDIPLEKDGYVHRIGRTGRAGKVGRAISLVTSDDIMSLYEIEEHIGTIIEELPLPTDAALNEQQTLIAEWKKANEHKLQPVRATGSTDKSRPKTKEAQGTARDSKPRSPKPTGNQPNKTDAQRQPKAPDKDGKPGRRTASSGRQDLQKSSVPPASIVEQPKPQPSAPISHDQRPAPAPVHVETVAEKPAESKKSWLERIKERFKRS